MASTLELVFHWIPTRTGNLLALCLLLDDPAGDGVGVGLLVVDPAGDGVGVGLLAVDPPGDGDGVGVCLVDGGGVICREDGGVLTGVFGVEFFLCLN